MGVRAVFVNARDRRSVASGEEIFTEGASGDEMFGVVEGTVELFREGQSIGRIGPGETFGEMAIISDAPRSATAVAVEDSVIASIDATTFVYLVHETPTFALQVMRSLADRIRDLDTRL